MIGLYFIIQSDRYTATSTHFCHSIRNNDKSSYFLDYKFYSEFVKFLIATSSSSKKKSSTRYEEPHHRSSTISASRSAHKLQRHQAFDFDQQNQSRFSFSSDEVVIEDANKFDSNFDDDQLSQNYGFELIEDENKVKTQDEFEEEAVSSNSKLDNELNEIIDLIVRDFMLKWIEEFIWDSDKFFSMAK
jgi:hypothetical protein